MPPNNCLSSCLLFQYVFPIFSATNRFSAISVPGENLKERFQLSTLQKIIELHRVMFASNRRLTFYEFEGEEGMQKHLATKPWMWPVLYRGCPGHLSEIHALYFIGSPQVYLLNFVVLCLLPLLAVGCAFQRARQPTGTGENNSGECRTGR